MRIWQESKIFIEVLEEAYYDGQEISCLAEVKENQLAVVTGRSGFVGLVDRISRTQIAKI